MLKLLNLKNRSMRIALEVSVTMFGIAVTYFSQQQVLAILLIGFVFCSFNLEEFIRFWYRINFKEVFDSCSFLENDCISRENSWIYRRACLVAFIESSAIDVLKQGLLGSATLGYLVWNILFSILEKPHIKEFQLIGTVLLIFIVVGVILKR